MVLQSLAVGGGGLLLGFNVPASVKAPAPLSASGMAPNAFLRITPDGRVTMTMPQVEMGQGIYTALAMILAEELDADFGSVSVVAAPPDDSLYANPLLGFQVTGGSTSVRAFWTPLRKAGAGARWVLVQAACTEWGVKSATCQTIAGRVRHVPTGRELSYGALTDRASRLQPPQDPALKSPSDFKLVGRSTRRLDTPDKVNGTARFGIDAHPPGCKVATLASCPVFGGRVAKVDDGRALTIAGVQQVVVLEDLVAVVADHYWAAKRGLAALNIRWDEGVHRTVSTAQVVDGLRAAGERDGAVAKTAGDGHEAPGGETLQATYQVPFLAHAPMEPMNCTVEVTGSSCEIWVGNQVVSRAQGIAAKITGLPVKQVRVNNHLIGGGFGRRLEVDYIEKSVRIAQKVTGPVKVVWSREEDIQQAMYRPMYQDRLSATMESGRIKAWRHKLIGSSVIARWAPPAFVKGIDPDAVDGAIDFPYETPSIHVEYVREEPPAVPTCFWRSVGPGHNIFVVESFVDELAHRAGQDPVKFRQAHLAQQPRLRACLELAATKAGWGTPLPQGAGRGVAVQSVFGSFLAAIAEVEVEKSGDINIRRVTCAIDCGMVVNPDTVAAQIEGGFIFGLSAALYGEIDIVGGRVRQSNFNNYRVLRMNEVPVIEVHLMPSSEAPGGIGEPGTSIAAPVVANAVFAATQQRLRRLPLTSGLRDALLKA